MSAELFLPGVPLRFLFPFTSFPKSMVFFCWCYWGMAGQEMWELRLGSSCLG